MAAIAAAEVVYKALLELRSYEEIQPQEAAKFRQVLIAMSGRLWWLDHDQYRLMTQDLSVALSRDVRDVLKFIHKRLRASLDTLQTTPVPAPWASAERCQTRSGAHSRMALSLTSALH